MFIIILQIIVINLLLTFQGLGAMCLYKCVAEKSEYAGIMALLCGMGLIFALFVAINCFM